MGAPRVFDRIRNFGGGVDSYRPASEIDVNQSQLMLNMIVKNNLAARTRPGADQVGSASFANVTPSGPVQGMSFFNNPTYTYVLAGEGGNLYTYNGAAWSTALAFTLSNSTLQFHAAQGIDAMMITDGVAYPRYWDGNTFTAYLAADGTFLQGCTILEFAAGRMIATGNAAYPDTLFLSKLLEYRPNSLAGTPSFDSATLSFRVGDGDGQAITCVKAMQNQLIAVLKENSVYLLSLNSTGTNPVNPIANWTAQSQGDKLTDGIGCVGKNAATRYKNDLLFMSWDGVYSLQRMQAAAGQYQLSTPLSEPIQPIIDRINWSVAYLIKATTYKNLVMFDVPLDIATSNNYKLIWDATLGCWTGYFTGLGGECSCVTRFNKIVELLFGAYDGSVSKWKDAVALQDLDATYQDNGVDIPWELDTRSLVFGNPDAQKKPRALLVRFNSGNTSANITATFDLDDTDLGDSAVQPTGGALPAILPMTLASLKPVNVYSSLEGYAYFNEVYAKISATSGWAEIRNITATAFIKTLRDPNS